MADKIRFEDLFAADLPADIKEVIVLLQKLENYWRALTVARLPWNERSR